MSDEDDSITFISQQDYDRNAISLRDNNPGQYPSQNFATAQTTVQTAPRVRKTTIGGVSRTTLLIIAVVSIVILVGVGVFIYFIPNITNGSKAGCTESGYENHHRGFGSDDGSCFYNQNNWDSKTIRTCPSLHAFYYDPGGKDANYTPLKDDQKVVNKSTIFQVKGIDPDLRLCFKFNSFSVANSGGCSANNLNISGTANLVDSRTYCNGAPPTLGKYICSDGNQTLKFTWNSDGKTNLTGWEVELHCGILGCMIPGAANYNPAATLDDQSCFFLPFPRATETVVKMCLDYPTYFYDSGGKDGDYQPFEHSLIQFQTLREGYSLHFCAEVYNIPSNMGLLQNNAGFFAFGCTTMLILSGNATNSPVIATCNAQNNLLPVVDFNATKTYDIFVMTFMSNGLPVSSGSGWRIRIDCKPNNP